MVEGFDKYGGVNSNATSVAALMAGEWTTPGNGTLVAPLSATGQALLAGATGASKTLSASYGRIIGGVRFSSTLGNTAGIQFLDAGSAQCGISAATSGVISLRNGSYSSGTILGSGATPISANTTHYLEWDITLGNSAAYNVYLDGVSIISGSGDTTATTNNTVSGFILGAVSGGTVTFDDLYLFDTTGTTNNAVLLTSPRIETTLPIGDSSVQFAIGASVLGSTVSRNTTVFSGGANQWYARAFTPSRSCTLNSITVVPSATNATVNLRPIIYSDSAGAPGSLLSAGSTVTGTTAGAALTMPLTTPQSLTAGTQYWLGYMVDVSLQMAGYDGTTVGRSGSATFSSGAPGTAPGNSAVTTALLWGNITLTTPANYYEVNQQPPPGANSYVYDATVAHEDLYNFPALSTPGAVIHSVAIKGFVQKSDSGTRTVSFRTKSGATDSAGSLAGQALGTSFQWYGSFFPTDPNTSAAWTVSALNTGGMRVDS
jgi:hypothetical protein